MTAIAIDGPSGAGKSTLARRIAGELGYIYVDTGAMYRSIGFFTLQNNIDTGDENAVEGILDGIQLEIARVDGVQHMLVNGEDVTANIRTEQVSMAASKVSAYPAVRKFLLDAQRNLAVENNIIMDGRDIGTVVLPNANVKIFLTATPQDRAKRRYDELIARGEKADYEPVLADGEKRDYNDANRAAAPLKQASDAVLVDTTGLSFEEGYALLKKTITERL
ncbi:MAG: (d)CMP kinase [Ruminococcaceae bacterium]|nr:(d)CMP kinase [Oscillospiraceae bacterium]